MLEKIKSFDDRLIEKIGKLHTPLMNKIMLFMTFLGDGGKIWFFIIAVILYFHRSVYLGTALLLSLGVGILTAEGIIKRIVCRVRPCHKMDEDELILKKMPHFYSFPSSHSATSFAVTTASFMLCNHWVALFMLCIALGIAFSRFYLQAHYLTDVICGVALGIVCGIITVKLVYVVLNSINPALIK